MKSFAHHYSSDISREQFELIRTDLEGIPYWTFSRRTIISFVHLCSIEFHA